jgi:uncharacterized membrane protein (DUF485 family)
MAVTGSGGPAGDAPRQDADIDWLAAERSPEFRELVKKRRSFVVPALAFVFIWYFGFIALAGYAPDFMGESVYEGLTVGYVLALSQFVMTWVLAAMYLRRADKVFDPLAERAAAKAVATRDGQAGDGAEAIR